jgi:anti-anti-sigma factor
VSEIGDLQVEEREGVALARLFGEVDLSNAQPVLARLTQAGLAAPRGLVVDLSETAYLDSSWIWLVTRLARALTSEGRGFLLVVPPQAPTRRMLDMLAIDELVPRASSVGDAVAALPPPGADAPA